MARISEAIEYIENAKFNLENVSKIGTAIVPLIDEQLTSALKILEEIDDGCQ
jgi:hypothetical protein